MIKGFMLAICLFITVVSLYCINKCRQKSENIAGITSTILKFGILVTIACALRFLIEDYFIVSCITSVMFIGMDFLLYHCTIASIQFTDGQNTWYRAEKITLFMVLVDTVILVVNPFKECALTYIETGLNSIGTYLYQPLNLFYFHLALGFYMLTIIAAIYIYKTVTVSSVYRMRYFPIAVVVVLTNILNIVFVIFDGVVIDLSTALYGLLAIAIYVFCFEFEPVRLVLKAKSLVMDHSTNAYIVFDNKDKMVSYNNTAKRMLPDLVNHTPAYTRLEWIDNLELNKFDNGNSNQEKVERKIGDKTYSIEMIEITDERDIYVGNYIRVMDITESKEILKEQWRLMSRDHLTGVLNRNSFIEQTKQMLKEYYYKKFSMVTIDIVHFKMVNEILGTAVADTMLKNTADVLGEMDYEIHTYGRIQSDHFALCICSEEFQPDKLLKALNERSSDILKGDFRYAMGIYDIENNVGDISNMIEWSTLALQSIKGNYNTQYAVFDKSVRDELLQKQDIVRMMEPALENGEFIIYVQPQYNHREGKIVGAEALVRWNNPEYGLIPPNKFIPIFEENGFITNLDRFVWEEACKVIRKSLDDGIDENKAAISVNISRVDFYNLDLTETFVELIEKYQLPPETLRLEITESAYVKGNDIVLETVKELQSSGFIVEMDDFGSGYSSLNVLKNIPVNVLKLDMKFLANNQKNEREGNILHSITRMARWLDLNIIAEGVEEKEQADYLNTIGCEVIQGYYYSKPLPVEQYETLIREDGALNTDQNEHVFDLDTFNEVWNLNSKYSDYFDNYIGAAGIVEYTKGDLECVRMNRRFKQYCSELSFDLVEELVNPLGHIDPQYYDEFMKMIVDSTVSKKSEHSLTKWNLPGTDEGRWFYCEAQLLVQQDEMYMILVRCSDATDLLDKMSKIK